VRRRTLTVAAHAVALRLNTDHTNQVGPTVPCVRGHQPAHCAGRRRSKVCWGPCGWNGLTITAPPVRRASVPATPRVAASLWKVDDAATASLMVRFYGDMLGGDLRPAEALRSAQLAMLQDKRWRDPYYWAAFELQGEWR